jgi:hypothetical protein
VSSLVSRSAGRLRRKGSRRRSAPLSTLPFDPGKMHQTLSVEVPDPITFVVSQKYLDRPALYPRQATLLKVIFLREDLFTQYDYDVVAEWEQSFAETGDNGVCPNVLERMRYLRANGYSWFREVLLVMGRRAGKGYVSALAMAYVLWCYMAKGDPQKHYGIDPTKQLACFIFASKKEHAIRNLWGDLYNVITNAPCYTDFISKALGTTLSVYAPADFLKMQRRADRGVTLTKDTATFLIDPKESTPMAGRGPASFCQGYDEMAHVVKAVAKADAGDVYDAAKPALDQFGKDGFIIAPSSPWEMTGKFYELWKQSIELGEDGRPIYWNKLMLQLSSWQIYEDWERTGQPGFALLPDGFKGDLGEYDLGGQLPPADTDLTELAKAQQALQFQPMPRFVPLNGAIQAYDDEMALEKRANPEKFAVEREAKWATVQDAYMIAARVREVFADWLGRPPEYGLPRVVSQSRGRMGVLYKAHGDPAEVNCRFGFAMAHVEHAEDGRPHVVFDLIKHWDPADYPDHILDYDEVIDWIYEHAVVPFMPSEVTFDQFNNVASVRGLQKKIQEGPPLPKNVSVFVKDATHANNWQRYEQLKAAINLGLVHAPSDTASCEIAEQELLFLQRGTGDRVDHPTTGPVQTKDVADCLMEIVSYLIGDQIDQFVYGQLANQRPGAALSAAEQPFGVSTGQNGVFQPHAGATAASARRGYGNPARAGRR